MNTSELIASELRSIRAKRDETIENVANHCDIHKDTLFRYENNLVPMRIDILEKLLNYYQVDIDIFFTNIYANKHTYNKN